MIIQRFWREIRIRYLKGVANLEGHYRFTTEHTKSTEITTFFSVNSVLSVVRFLYTTFTFPFKQIYSPGVHYA